MGWFENQIEERRLADQQLLEESLLQATEAVMGRRVAERINDKRMITQNALDEILKYYHLKPAELPREAKNAEEQLDACLRPHGFMPRSIELDEGWYRDAYGPILAYTRGEGLPVALLPGRISGYRYKDPQSGLTKRVNRQSAKLFEREAYCFYRPLPQRKLTVSDLLLYMKRCVSFSDILMMAAASLAVTGVGLFLPRVTRTLTGPILKSGRANALIAVAICTICISLSVQLINSISGLVQNRLLTKTSLGVQSSLMMRILNLPTAFFRKYSPGELKSRSMAVNQLCTLLLGIVLSSGLSAFTSLLYLVQILRFAPALALPALLIVLLTVAVMLVSLLLRIRLNRKLMELNAKESGMSYSLISGIQKIKLAGAEKRVFAKWLGLFAQGAALSYNPPLFLKLVKAMTLGISLLSTILLYFLAVKSGVEPSQYYAFTISYGMLMGAFTALMEMVQSASQLGPILEMAKPFLQTEPETARGGDIVHEIRGGIELSHVTFRYDKEGPAVLDDLSLKINPGEYVAVVGRTGCGKSTLVRLLLGFEKPEKGIISYDGRDMESLDLPSLRRKIGTVTQDAGLFQGDIYSNIVITAPELKLEDAWEAAETAGIAEDIRSMPMGMHTMIAEGQGGISGGQRQRIMIARAIAPKPKLLIFDEATSALDNKTQKQVSEALDRMGCTRLVIAHRLSTIRHCDRILVLDGGKIREEGSYDQLIAQNGFFAELVRRQRLDTEEA